MLGFIAALAATVVANPPLLGWSNQDGYVLLTSHRVMSVWRNFSLHMGVPGSYVGGELPRGLRKGICEQGREENRPLDGGGDQPMW